jgi:hypothetical protein
MPVYHLKIAIISSRLCHPTNSELRGERSSWWVDLFDRLADPTARYPLRPDHQHKRFRGILQPQQQGHVSA